MATYPNLTSSEQAALPALTKTPTVMPAKFADSTHQLWHCETVDGPMVLKVCNHASIAQSSFWQGLNQLFGMAFPSQLGQTSNTANYLNQHGAITTPKIISAVDDRYVLTQFLAGSDVDQITVSDAFVNQLGQHIGQLHQQHFPYWGTLHNPSLPHNKWAERLHTTLQNLAETSHLHVPPALLATALTQARNIDESIFAPIMPDLRWDQFRQCDNGELALIDLDAFVIGPRTLELVLILYLLTPDQLAIFKNSYCQHNTWPDLSPVLPCYQMLLFLLNVLGETDCHTWMTGLSHHGF